jgi:hypothetical protein
MRMLLIVMFKPNFQLIHEGSRVRPIGHSDLVTFESFNKAFGHAITLRALDRCRNRLRAQGSRKGTCLASDVARLIIRKPLHFLGCHFTGTKPIFNSLHHQVPNKIGVDSLGRSHPTHYFSVATIQGKRDPNLFTVIAPNFKTVEAPAGITLIDGDRSLMFSSVYRTATLAIKKQVVISHQSINPCGAHAVNSVFNTLITQSAPDTPIPIGAEIFNQYADISKHRRVLRFRRRPSSIHPRGLSFCKSRHLAARYIKNRADNSYCSSLESKGDRAIFFRALPYSTASLRISFSNVLRPKESSNCLIRLRASPFQRLEPQARWHRLQQESLLGTPFSIGKAALQQCQVGVQPMKLSFQIPRFA